MNGRSGGAGGGPGAHPAGSGELQYVLRPASGSPGDGAGRGGRPAGALLLLHGRGTDERDLLPLLDELDPDGRLTGVTVRAPLELTPGGYHWYVVREIGHPDEPSFRRTYEQVTAWLDRLPEITGVPLERTAIGGFSQGAVMSYALALGRGRPSPPALLAFSGFIPEVPGFFELDLEGHRGVPVAVGHGALDRVIPVQSSRSAVERLQAVGMDVSYHESPTLAHGIDVGFVREAAEWLAEHTRTERRAA
jgi:phospholipase/carboxylesterase